MRFTAVGVGSMCSVPECRSAATETCSSCYHRYCANHLPASPKPAQRRQSTSPAPIPHCAPCRTWLRWEGKPGANEANVQYLLWEARGGQLAARASLASLFLLALGLVGLFGDGWGGGQWLALMGGLGVAVFVIWMLLASPGGHGSEIRWTTASRWLSRLLVACVSVATISLAFPRVRYVTLASAVAAFVALWLVKGADIVCYVCGQVLVDLSVTAKAHRREGSGRPGRRREGQVRSLPQYEQMVPYLAPAGRLPSQANQRI
jgi:hypothetical protein